MVSRSGRGQWTRTAKSPPSVPWAAIRRGDWPAIESFFAQIADPDEYAVYTRIAAETRGTEDYLRAIVHQNRMSDLAMLLYGSPGALARFQRLMGFIARPFVRN